MSETYKETYSISYDGDAYQCAADWNWRRILGKTLEKTPDQWARSDKDGPGNRWYTTEGLDNNAYQALLKHFWLEDYADEFPIEKVIFMSPAELAAARRKKEELYMLERKVMVNTIGEHRPAEEYK